MQEHFGASRSEVSEILWKATAVPQLTYCNAVITMPKWLGNHIEVRQRDAGRWAFGIPYSTVSKEFIEGELGWSSFDARETTSKMMYFERIERTDSTRWPSRVLTATEITNMKVKSVKRLKKLKPQFNLENLEVTHNASGTPIWNKFRKELRTREQNE